MKLSPSRNKSLTAALIFGIVLTAGVAVAHAENGSAKRDFRTQKSESKKQDGVSGPGHLFAKVDANRDGVLSLEETRGLAPEKLSRLDVNGDGTITKKEARLVHKQAMKDRFAEKKALSETKAEKKPSAASSSKETQAKDAPRQQNISESQGPRGEKGRTMALKMRKNAAAEKQPAKAPVVRHSSSK